MSTVTLIGDRLAEVDREFVYRGEAPGCEGCPYRSQCLNLTEGKRYRITDIRENAQLLDCAVHDKGVRAVEVEPANVRANVPREEPTPAVKPASRDRVHTPSVQATSFVCLRARRSKPSTGSLRSKASHRTITVCWIAH